MSRTTRNRRKKASRRSGMRLQKLISKLKFPPIDPSIIDTYNAIGASFGMSPYTSTPRCEDDSYGKYASTLPGAYYEDLLGDFHDHYKNDQYIDQGVYEDFSGQPDPDKRYGPHLCTMCNDKHPNCQRVRCNVCGRIERRHRWVQRIMMKMHVEKPRAIMISTVS